MEIVNPLLAQLDPLDMLLWVHSEHETTQWILRTSKQDPNYVLSEFVIRQNIPDYFTVEKYFKDNVTDVNEINGYIEEVEQDLGFWKSMHKQLPDVTNERRIAARNKTISFLKSLI